MISRMLAVWPPHTVSGGTTCLTLLVYRMFSSDVANNVADCGDPRHEQQRITQVRPY